MYISTNELPGHTPDLDSLKHVTSTMFFFFETWCTWLFLYQRQTLHNLSSIMFFFHVHLYQI